jgi:hypothetical protein
MELYEDLFQQSSTDGYWLRSSIGTTSCKMSALIYMIIHLLMGQVPPSRIPLLTRKIIHYITKTEDTSTQDLKKIMSNHSVNGKEITDTTFLKDNTMWYVGLVKKSHDTFENIIDHYFVIVKEGESYKTISSYGCSLVYMKQYEKPLDLDELDAFIKALQQEVRTRATKQLIRDFMIKYFLHLDHYVEKEVEPDENEGRSTTDPTLRDTEVEGYVTSKYHMEFYPIADTLQSIIDKLCGMRKKKTRKGKRKHYVYLSRSRFNSLYKK